MPIPFQNYLNLGSKQNNLVSGTNIKTVDGKDITGAGNLSINNLPVWKEGDTPIYTFYLFDDNGPGGSMPAFTITECKPNICYRSEPPQGLIITPSELSPGDIFHITTGGMQRYVFFSDIPYADLIIPGRDNIEDPAMPDGIEIPVPSRGILVNGYVDTPNDWGGIYISAKAGFMVNPYKSAILKYLGINESDAFTFSLNQ